MKQTLINHINTLGLSFIENEMNDILIENKLALHFVDFFTEKEPLKRWKYYYDKEIRCVFIYPTYNIEIYKNIVAYHFGKVQKIFARKCEVRILKAKDIKPFFEQNNIEGYRQADKAYCLFYNNELMMAYSVGHAFFGKGKYDLEIARGACKMGYQIVGGASRLWKAIINDNPLVQTIVYYVDRREYDGRSMKFLNNVDTSYFGGESFMNYWVKENRYANREPARNAEIVAGYHDGSIIQVKNPGSWTNVYKVEPNRCYVYKVTNKKTGKYYIGSKTTLNADNYYIGYNYFTSSTDTEFVEDFKKNTNAWKHEVLKYFDDKQDCLDYEATLIEEAWENDRDNLINKGFVRKNKKTNHIVTSHCNEKGWHHSEEAKRKVSEANKGRPCSEEHKRRLSETLKGKKFSEVHRENLAEAIRTKVINSDGYKNRKARSRDSYTEEWKQKISEQTALKMAENKQKDIDYIHSLGYIVCDDLVKAGWTYGKAVSLKPVGKYKRLKYFNKELI